MIEISDRAGRDLVEVKNPGRALMLIAREFGHIDSVVTSDHYTPDSKTTDPKLTHAKVRIKVYGEGFIGFYDTDGTLWIEREALTKAQEEE